MPVFVTNATADAEPRHMRIQFDADIADASLSKLPGEDLKIVYHLSSPRRIPGGMLPQLIWPDDKCRRTEFIERNLVIGRREKPGRVELRN